jgi:DNA-binding CsgD family transcriptional regulator
VKQHVHNIFEKLGIRRRYELIAGYAVTSQDTASSNIP